jgi:hypothetical protein
MFDSKRKTAHVLKGFWLSNHSETALRRFQADHIRAVRSPQFVYHRVSSVFSMPGGCLHNPFVTRAISLRR